MLVYDLVDPVELQGFVRNIPLPEFALERFLPDTPIEDIEYRFDIGSFADMDVAPFRSYDTESPIGNRPGLSRRSGSLPPISKQMRLGEEQLIRLRGLRGGRGVRPDLVNQIFDDARRLARAVVGRIELARGDAIFTGHVHIAENGLSADIDYGYTNDQFVDANDDIGKYLDDPTSDALGYLGQLIDAYNERTDGALPGVILAPRKFRSALLRNQGIIKAVRGNVGGANQPSAVSQRQLAELLVEYDIPPIALYDTKVKVGGVSTRITPADKIALLPAGQLGRTFWGVTAEAIELVEAQQIAADLAPGLTATNSKTVQPVATWTNVGGISIPAIGNSNEVTVATVLSS